MRAFSAIVKITLLSAVRSKVFQFLLALLLVCVFGLPMTLRGDGTALGHVKVSVEYSLFAVGLILSLSAIWLSCHAMISDIDGYQAHMLFVKPVSRYTAWLGKFTGVLALHAILLVIAAGLVYALVMWRLDHANFTPAEMEKLRQEVLVGREVYHQALPDLNALAMDEYRRREAMARREGQPLAIGDREKLYKTVWQEVVGKLGEVKAFGGKDFEFKGVSVGASSPVFLRYRVFVGSYDAKKRQNTQGIWAVKVPLENLDLPEDQKKAFGPSVANENTGGYMPLSFYPEDILSNYFYEVALSAKVVDAQGDVRLSFHNYDPENRAVFFQLAESPQLLVRKVGFFGNYLRAVGLLLLRIAIIAGISCSLGGLFSLPIAVFLVASYLFFGVVSSYLAPDFGGFFRDAVSSASTEDFDTSFEGRLGRVVSKALLVFVIPAQRFEGSEMLSSGRLIGAGYFWGLFVEYFLLRGLPCFALGMWLYSRRELGAVVKT